MALRRSGSRDHDEGVRFSRTFTAFLFVMCAILIAFDRPAARPEGLTIVRATIGDMAAPLLDLAARPLRAVRNIGPWWAAQDRLVQENIDLRRELNETRYWRDMALRLRDQIEIYEEALNLDTPAARNRIGAWALADSSGTFVRSRLIGAGALAGVSEGDPVLNVYGLVGRVVTTGRRSSRVLLLTDLNSRIPVIVDRTNARAVLGGDNTAYPRLEYLDRDAELREGDRIVTSGDDGVLPRGLPVGVAARDRYGAWRVRLFSDQAPVDFVWVFPFQRIAAPEADAPQTEPIEPPGIADSSGPGAAANAESAPAAALGAQGRDEG